MQPYTLFISSLHFKSFPYYNCRGDDFVTVIYYTRVSLSVHKFYAMKRLVQGLGYFPANRRPARDTSRLPQSTSNNGDAMGEVREDRRLDCSWTYVEHHPRRPVQMTLFLHPHEIRLPSRNNYGCRRPEVIVLAPARACPTRYHNDHILI